MQVPPSLREVTTRVGNVERFNALDVVRAPTGRLPVTLISPFQAGFAVPYNPSLAVEKTQWDFGDGTRAKGIIVQHAFATAGSYPVKLSVTDKHGHTVEADLTVKVDE